MHNKKIAVIFGWRSIVFFTLLELLTVPPVAMTNSIVMHNIWYMAIMGFSVAMLAMLVLLKLVKTLLLKYCTTLLEMVIVNITGLGYIAMLAGVLLLIMFMVQEVLFKYGLGDFSVGFISAVASVGLTLMLYKLGLAWGLGLRIVASTASYLLDIEWLDILRLAITFGIYEFLVCPITGWWIPYPEHRFSLAVVSGVIGGVSGGVAVSLISQYLDLFRAKLILRRQSENN